MCEKHVSKDTLTRIISDIKEITKNPLENDGIYYIHDSNNVLDGYALIIPSNDSPYRYGNYLFTIHYPINYPYNPPLVKFMTNNGTTRFHPNLYRNGKVCLSLLNTWKGDQWTSCNTLSSILLNLLTLFTKDPFLHEPGIKENHPDFNNYTQMVEYQNYCTSIYKIIFDKEYKKTLTSIEPLFRNTIKEVFEHNKDKIVNDIETKAKTTNELFITVPFYKMEDTLNYKELMQKLKEYNN